MELTKTNPHLTTLVSDLHRVSHENKSNVWKRLADDLVLPRRNKVVVNVLKLGLYSKDGDVVVVPGKVLGSGDITHKVTVAAFGFSKSAVDKIKSAKGSVMTIQELMHKNPKGKDVRIFG